MRRLGLSFVLTLAGMVCLLPARGATNEVASAKGEPALIDAKQLSFEREQNLAIGEGDVVIHYKGAVLRADKVKFNTETKDAWAEGNVRLNRANQEWAAPVAYYNFETRAFKANDVRAFVEPVIVQGYDVSQTGSNQYRVARVTATTCDYADPHYRVEAKRAEIWPGDRMVMYNVTVRMGDVPVFWFPVMIWSLKKGDYQPMSLNLGDSSRWGFFTLLTTYWRLNENARLAVHTDERTGRGPGTGADLKYRLGPTGAGLLSGYYISDANPQDRVDELYNHNLPNNRYRVEWQHTQPDLFKREGLDLKIDINKQSDSDVVNDFFHGDYLRGLEPQSVVDVTQCGENYTVSVLTRPQLNRFFAEVERLPEATWAVNRRQIGETPLFYEQISSVGYLNNVAGNTNSLPGSTADPFFIGHALRAYTFQQLLVPMSWFDFLSVIPHAGMGGEYYSDSPTNSTDGVRTERAIYNLGVETSFKMSRTWDSVQCKSWRIDGLRHILQPFADYSWTPRPDNTTNQVYQFDTVRSVQLYGGDLLSLTRYSPIEYPAFNTIDAIDRQDVLRFGLRQELQTRRVLPGSSGKQTWNLLELETWTDWRAERNPGQHSFSELFGTVRARPLEWVVLNADGRYDMHDGLLKEFNAEARVFDADRWSVGLGTRYIRDDSSLMSFSFAWRLTPHWVAQTYHRVDWEDRRWEAQEYTLRQETHDWLITYGVRVSGAGLSTSGQKLKPSELMVFVGFTLRAFPNTRLTTGGVDLGAN